MQQTERRNSTLWPLLLIGIGLVWLLRELNILSSENISVLFRLWPVILIGIGVAILVGHRSPNINRWIGGATIAVIFVLMLIGPSLGLAQALNVKTSTYQEGLGDASAARVTIGSTIESTNVSALKNSANLIEANLGYINPIRFDVSGQATKTVLLQEQGSVGFTNPFDWFNVIGGDKRLNWDVYLSPNVPLNLTVSTGTGTSNLDLSGLKLSALSVNGGTGRLELSLPSMESSYDVTASVGTGSATFRLAEGIAVSIDVNSGTGSATFDLPNNAAVRLVASTGTGSINVPSYMHRVGTADDNPVGESGTWESSGFASAERQIIIRYEGGTGSLNVN